MYWTNFKSYFKFLSRNKLYTIVTVFGFAISLMFVFLLSIYIRQELSVDKFHANKDRIYLLARDNTHGGPLLISGFSNPVADVIKDKCPEVEDYTRIVFRAVQIDMGDKEKIKAEALFADSAFFKIFSFKLLEGDPSTVLSTKQSAVITRSYANKIFPNENPVGKTLKIADTELVIQGIAEDFPQNTQIPRGELILNYQMIGNYWGGNVLESWGNSSFGMYFLAKPGTDLPAQAPMLLEEFKKNYWIYTNGFAKEVLFVNLQDVYFGEVGTSFSKIKTNNKTIVSIYLIIVILILVVAVLNYINLSVSLAVKRGKESAIKKLLGSSRKALFIQFISEAMIMTIISLLIGIFLAFLAEPFFNDVLSTQLHLGEQFSVGFVFTLIAAVVIIGFLSGLFPALAVSRFKPIEVVKGTYTYNVKAVYSKVLITFQYIIAIALLIYSIFIIRQTDYMRNYDMGFEKDNIFVMDNLLKPQRLPGLRDQLMSIAGVEKVSFTSGNPLDGGNNNSFEFEGQPVSFQVFEVDSVFFDIFDIKVHPTGITPTKETILLNRNGFEILHPDSGTFTVNYGKGQNETIEGIVENFNFSSLHNAVQPLKIYKMTKDSWPWSIVVKIAAGSDIYQTANEIKRVYSDYNGGSVYSSAFAEESVQKWYEQEEKNMKIISAFTLLTIIILMMGIFSMALYYVRQKEKEIAIRKVEGATEFEIIKMLNMDFFKRIVLAFVIAVPIAYLATVKFLQAFAYKINISWWVFILAGLFIAVLSVIFVTMQSWKTATTNPVEYLKNE